MRHVLRAQWTRSRLRFVPRSHVDLGHFVAHRSSLMVSRSHTDHPLNLTPFDITHSLETKEAIHKIPNAQTNRLINDFFQSIIANNFNRSRLILDKLSDKINLNYYHTTGSNLITSQTNNYYSCLLLLVTNSLFFPESIVIQNIKLLVDDFQSVEKKLKECSLPDDVLQLKREIKLKLVICLVHCFGHNSPVNMKMVHKSMASYIMNIMKEFQIDEYNVRDEILLHPKMQLQEPFLDICKLNKIKIEFPKKNCTEVVDDLVSIESYKDSNGFISFNQLCKYISETRFQKYGRSKKLYQIYDELDEDEKHTFIKEYLHFNHYREINVENHSLDLVEDFDSIHTQNNSRIKRNYTTLSKFKKSHEPILYEWLSSNLSSFSTMMANIKKNGKLTGLEVDLEKYRTHLTVIPKNALITMLLSTLLSKTIACKEGYAILSEIARDLALSFTRLIIREPSYNPLRSQLIKFFSQDDGLKLCSALVKMCLDNCTIEIPPATMKALQQSLALSNEIIDKQFLSHDHGKYKAFSYSLIHRDKSVKVTGVIKIHPYLFHEFKAYTSLAFNKSLYFPMLTIPKPWVSPTEGGYLNDLKPIVSTTDLPTSLQYLSKAHATGQMESLYTSLNNLGSNAWAINSRIMDVVNETMTWDDGFLKIPPALHTLKADTHEDYHNLKNLRLEYNMIQAMANSFDANGDMFYLPHCIDFRGRAYPMVSLLSHYQEDVVRALMMFWYSKPLGGNGLNWIKYQLAGSYGMDKLSMDERILFVDKNILSIIDSSQHPLKGQMWWKGAEKPWQTLSLCMELDLILEYQKAGHNIESYLCRIPIHQDGSCNGLQHYAALGADEEGGRSVNLIPLPNNQRGDIYTKVLDIVREKVLKDIPKRQIALVAKEILSRKLVKQTIMTTVYGVTVYGGSAQIASRIKDIYQNLEQTDPTSKLSRDLKRGSSELSFYLSTLVLNSISDLFSGAKRIQDWLVENCLRVITSFDMDTIKHTRNLYPHKEFSFFDAQSYKPMMWTSISGFPVVQLYKHTKQINIPTALQSITIMKPQKLAPINKRKQLNAIAPNFVHSLDSLHMFMTSVAAKQHNIGFASVHDSFWTYPNEVEKLSKILRQEFIRLHTSDIVEHLRQDMNHSVSDSFQLVWIHNDQPIVSEIRHLRATYPVRNNDNLLSKKSLDKLLMYEMESISNGEPNKIEQLVSKYRPELYSRNHNSAQYLSTYITSVDQPSKVYKSSLTKFTPILLPVRILDSPKTGKLDINQVLNSTYFFL